MALFSNRPWLSIISVCYNDLNNLKKTISSISYTEHIEQIVVDGRSKDGTKDYLNTLINPQIRWISEPDLGIYDAMNKGLDMATGEYIIFMNAGDLFYDTDTISSICNILTADKPDILYGDAMLIDDDGTHLGLRSKVTTRKLPVVLHWKDMKGGMLVCHQSFIVKRNIAPTYILKNLSADIDWQIRCLKQATKIKYVDFPICRYLVGGTSEQQHLRSLIDRFNVMSIHYGYVKAIWYHLLILIRVLKFRFIRY